jgi:CheY-like chemotaxis protein
VAQGGSDLRGIPIIAVTALSMKGDEEKIRQGAARRTSPSRFSVSKFLETVDRF